MPRDSVKTKRDKSLDELTAETERLGLYDKPEATKQRKIILYKQDNGDYYADDICGAAIMYTGEDAKILDILFKYQKKDTA